MTDQDLNLLKTFAFLLEERHISRVAARLHVTQPAISRALARLRVEFNDPLFVRTPKGMEITCASKGPPPTLAQMDLVEAVNVEKRDAVMTANQNGDVPADAAFNWQRLQLLSRV